MPVCDACGKSGGSAVVGKRGLCYICHKAYYRDGYSYEDEYYRRKFDTDGTRRRMQEYEDANRRKLMHREEQKARRLSAAIRKECSECGQGRPHDPDDYKCIVCRDGQNALPKLAV